MVDIYATEVINELPQIEFINEKGNVRASIRNKIHTAMIVELSDCFEDDYVVPNVNGGFSVPQGIDAATGQIIWAHVCIKVNTKHPTVDDYTGKPKTKASTPVIPNLFD